MKPLFFLLLLLAGPAFGQEDRLIAILKSDAPVKDKGDACRELARVGTRQAVPVLAPLLLDENLSHLARYALESIPDRSVDAAFRDALGTLKGRALAGVIVSLGVRKDAQAVEPVARFLTDADLAVAQAAARALGSIGAAAVPALEQALAIDARGTRLAVCEGLFRCAESMPAPDANGIYEKVRRLPDLPEQFRLAALRGAIRSRGSEGLPLLMEAIRGQSSVPSVGAIRIAMELPEPEVTKVLIGELVRANPETQVLLIQALGYRGDRSAVAVLEPLVQRGSAGARSAAIRSLVQLGEPASIPSLVAAIKDGDAAVSSAAQTGLFAFRGRTADTAVLALLSESDAHLRIAAIDAASQRRLAAAVPILLRLTGDTDTEVAGASFRALGQLAELAEIPSLVDALSKTKAVTAGEAALSAVCARQPDLALCTRQLLPGLGQAQGEPKFALIRVLAGLGSPEALVAVRAAAAQTDSSETALRALCDWPTVAALPDLVQITKSSADPRFKILALRGQLRLIPMQTLADAEKLSQLMALLPLLERAEEKRLALATLAEMPSAESLGLILPFLSVEEFKEEASVAAVGVGEKIVTTEPVAVSEAMIWVQTSNAQLAGRIRQLLARVPAGAAQEGSIFNGKDLSGWEGKPGWWSVQDGALTSESTPEKPCKKCNYLFWRGGQPANFDLRADFMLSPSANSGLQIRSEERPDWDTFGYQADMTGNGDLVGFVYHHQRGLIAGRGERAAFAADGSKTVERFGDAAQLLKHFKQGGWNSYRVVCRGPEITLYVNGVLMCQIVDHQATQAAAGGHLALQMHPGPPMKVQFKNIRLTQWK